MIKETYFTERNEKDNVDSPAFWKGPDGQHWLLTTAKSTDVVLVFDAATGDLLDRFGGTGTRRGEMQRPNGIVIVDNYALVVERDNHRVQVFRLPEFIPLGFFARNTLIRPYGIAAYANRKGIEVFITDNYETPEEQIPRPEKLGHRVHHYRLQVHGDSLQSTHIKAFGDTTGSGILHKVESINVDTMYNRLLIADEDSTQKDVKVYKLDGTFTGTTVGNSLFAYEPEGIALYACGDGSGYWIMTDQSMQENLFRIFDRRSLSPLGAFSGEKTRNTDGVALTRQAFGPFKAGAFFPVHNDGNVAAISWFDIAGQLSLTSQCIEK